VSLASVLGEVEAEPHRGLHVAFACADVCEQEGKCFNYSVSIPIRKAMTEDVLLAWALNGEVLAAEHGYPLRVVVPGYAGVRSPKWLTAIAVQDAPSDSPIQADDYRLFPSDRTKQTADPACGVTINDMPVNSAICTPAAHTALPAGLTVISGYAVATSRRIVRVDVSADEGRSWRQAASWRCAPGTRPGRPSQTSSTKSGTTKAIFVRHCTACRSASSEDGVPSPQPNIGRASSWPWWWPQGHAPAYYTRALRRSPPTLPASRRFSRDQDWRIFA
jgi:DMSO/TMAO reductase YedYZ molybdopterin-dependent catalytic subunit